MRTYDISLTLSPNSITWPGETPVLLERIQKIEEGDSANVTRLCMSVHTGTHVDAPCHFLNGDLSVDKLPMEILNGRAYLLHLPDANLVTSDILERSEIPPRTRRVLLKTRNSQYWQNQETSFQTDFVGLSADGAEYLVHRGVKLIGVDYLSVAPFGVSKPTHEILLKAGVVIVEGLDLSNVSQGRYTLHCLPLKIADADGAPARAILVGV